MGCDASTQDVLHMCVIINEIVVGGWELRSVVMFCGNEMAPVEAVRAGKGVVGVVVGRGHLLMGVAK